MAKPQPRWIDAPEFHWTPERPFGETVAPKPPQKSAPQQQIVLAKKPAANDDTIPTPRPRVFHAAGVAIAAAITATVAGIGAAITAAITAVVAAIVAGILAALATVAAALTAAILRILSIRTPGYFLTRLTIGLLQGFGLLALAATHSDNGLIPALGLVLLFVPLLLLAGLDRVPGKLLLPWMLIASIALAVLGSYQHWREPGAPGVIAIGLVAIILFVGQAIITASAKRGQLLADYSAYHESAWILAMQFLFGALAAAASFVLAGNGLALLRQHYPSVHPNFLLTPIVTFSVALMSWLAFPALLRLLQRCVQTLLTVALPMLAVLAASAGVAGVLQHWQPPLQLCLALGFLLLLCLNASYRDGGERPRWNQLAEFITAFALIPPFSLGVWALSARVSQAGWTGMRILAAAALFLLGAYTLFYIAAALIGRGGGGWMKRIERANLVMAVVILALSAALLSPIADPERLAVAAQMQRLDTGKVAADDFDFAWLNTGGGRFGHQALEQLAGRKDAPDQARGAFLALLVPPDSVRPAPTQIGANIDVRTPNARLPAALLARDWSRVTTPGVPPCLTTAALFCDAYFMDLDGDGRNEIVLVYGNNTSWWAAVMKQNGQGGWAVAGTLAAPPCRGSFDALRAGHFAPVVPLPGWQDLMVGGTRLAVVLTGQKKPSCS